LVYKRLLAKGDGERFFGRACFGNGPLDAAPIDLTQGKRGRQGGGSGNNPIPLRQGFGGQVPSPFTERGRSGSNPIPNPSPRAGKGEDNFTAALEFHQGGDGAVEGALEGDFVAGEADYVVGGGEAGRRPLPHPLPADREGGQLG